ncbi:FHA domain-containing protein [Porphyromonas gulae]|uniref:FHA domain-containing protein n=1 Tax=Porphyromonas gulae TaxID=111105 RepID=UPI0026EE2D39|nr:FHA domain-containing protein [Porphyromonas gulae]
MKRVFCPKCDGSITISRETLSQVSPNGSLSLLCPHCCHQLRIRVVSKSTGSRTDKKPQGEQEVEQELDRSRGYLVVLENVFGYRQEFALKEGDNGIGRRNKDSVVDIAVLTGDPSMGRHHCILRVTPKKDGSFLYSIADDDSLVGTFVGGRLLAKKERCRLNDGDVITMGATSAILYTADHKDSEPEEKN